MSDFEPRRAGPDDAAALTDLVRLAYSKYVPRIGMEPGPMREDYSEVIATRPVWLVESAGDLLAALVLCHEPGCLLVENIAVHPDAQGGGLGSRLLEWAEDAARRSGRSAVRLYTHSAMTENIAFYRRRGFVVTGRETQDAFSRVFLGKRLEPPSGNDCPGAAVIAIAAPTGPASRGTGSMRTYLPYTEVSAL